jgi:hypothetical protein
MKTYFLSLQSTKTKHNFSGIIAVTDSGSVLDNFEEATKIMVAMGNKIHSLYTEVDDYIVLSFNNVT